MKAAEEHTESELGERRNTLLPTLDLKRSFLLKDTGVVKNYSVYLNI